MTRLRQRMLDALQVRGMAQRTQDAYIDAAARLARRLLAMPAPNPCALEQAQDFMHRVAGIEIERCPHCKLGRWRVGWNANGAAARSPYLDRRGHVPALRSRRWR